MKYINNKIVVLLLAISLFATSCDSFLEEENYTSLSIETAQTDPEAFDQLVARVYEISREFTTHYTSDMYYQLEDLGTDIVTRGSLVTGTNDLNDYVNFNSTNWTVSVYWTDQYAIISAANIAIDNADDIEGVDTNAKATGIGEAKFFRAMSYFNLVENFGGVPLVLNQVTTAEINYVRAYRTRSIYSNCTGSGGCFIDSTSKSGSIRKSFKRRSKTSSIKSIVNQSLQTICWQ